MSIDTGEIIKGNIPKKAFKFVKEWILMHQEELSFDWELAQKFEPLEKVQGAKISGSELYYQLIIRYNKPKRFCKCLVNYG